MLHCSSTLPAGHIKRRSILCFASVVCALMLLTPSAASALTTTQKITRLQKAVSTLQAQVKTLKAQVAAKHTLRSGSGAPATTLGVAGDFYLDTAATALYGPKTAGGWGEATSLIGPTGATGPAGPKGDIGPEGPPGPAADNGISKFHQETEITLPFVGRTELLKVPGYGVLSTDQLWIDSGIPTSYAFMQVSFTNTSTNDVRLYVPAWNRDDVVPPGGTWTDENASLNRAFHVFLSQGSGFAQVDVLSVRIGDSINLISQGFVVQ